MKKTSYTKHIWNQEAVLSIFIQKSLKFFTKLTSLLESVFCLDKLLSMQITSENITKGFDKLYLIAVTGILSFSSLPVFLYVAFYF